MRMNKLYKAMFALAATGTLLPVAPALAAAPDPGPGWVLTGQQTVRTWVPDAGAGWVLVGQREVTEFVADPVSSPLPAGANGAGHWEMVHFRDRNYFVADSAITRKLVATNKQQQYVSAGTQRFDAERVQVDRTPREVRTDLKNPSKETLDNGIYSVYKYVQIDTWDDVQYKSPVFNMKQKQVRDENVFQFQWADGIYGNLMSEPDSKLDYTAWTNSGATERNGLARYDLWDQLVKENANTVKKDLLLARVPLTLASNEAAKAKSATFLSDSGSGGSATSVAGSQKRAVFKADEAVVAEKTKQESKGGGIGADDLNLPGNGNGNGNGASSVGNLPSNPKVDPTPTPIVVRTPAPIVLQTPAPVILKTPFQQLAALQQKGSISKDELNKAVFAAFRQGSPNGDQDAKNGRKVYGYYTPATGEWVVFEHKNGNQGAVLLTGTTRASSNTTLELARFSVNGIKMVFYVNNPQKSSYDPVIDEVKDNKKNNGKVINILREIFF